MIDLNTHVALYAGYIDWTGTENHEPEWRGTLGEFWHDNEGAYHSFEYFQEELSDPGYIYLGGVAQPEFTLCVDVEYRPQV
jgi:hypothetical protein